MGDMLEEWYMNLGSETSHPGMRAIAVAQEQGVRMGAAGKLIQCREQGVQVMDSYSSHDRG